MITRRSLAENVSMDCGLDRGAPGKLASFSRKGAHSESRSVFSETKLRASRSWKDWREIRELDVDGMARSLYAST